jgi:RNA polymerase sigma-70 factor (sigma-E family)
MPGSRLHSVQPRALALHGTSRIPAVHDIPQGKALNLSGNVAALGPSSMPVRQPLVADVNPDAAIRDLYITHYLALVRLATFLVRDSGTAEEVVQDAFVSIHGSWAKIRDSSKAAPYLRQAVVNRSRSVLRRRAVEEKHGPDPLPDAPAAEQAAFELLDRSAVVAALRTLSPRQREVLVLRYYADLSESDTARTMGISQGAVKSHTARALTALRAELAGRGERRVQHSRA